MMFVASCLFCVGCCVFVAVCDLPFDAWCACVARCMMAAVRCLRWQLHAIRCNGLLFVVRCVVPVGVCRVLFVVCSVLLCVSSSLCVVCRLSCLGCCLTWCVVRCLFCVSCCVFRVVC